MEFLKNFKKRIILFLAVIGPGVITAMADNDAGGVATYSIVGSKYGYSMLFVLLLITILLALTQEMGARLSIVTGKGLGDLIRENYGVKKSVYIFILLFIANMGSILANFAGLKAGLMLFNVPVIPLLVVFAILISISVYKGNYKTNQAIFLGSAFLYIAYIFSAILAKPDWELALRSIVVPTNMKLSNDFIFSAIAVLGTTITPWGQFFISSFILDKKMTPGSLKYEQLEVFFGAFLTNFFSFFMIVACAATLYMNGIMINSAGDAAMAIKPFAGEFAAALLGLGLINAGFIGAVVVSLTTSYAFSEFFGYEGSLDGPQSKSKSFYAIFFIQIVLALILVMLPNISLFKIALYTQSLNGILLPMIIFFLLKFANDKELMGQYTNNRFYNVFAVISAIVIILASVFVMVGAFMGWA